MACVSSKQALVGIQARDRAELDHDFKNNYYNSLLKYQGRGQGCWHPSCLTSQIIVHGLHGPKWHLCSCGWSAILRSKWLEYISIRMVTCWWVWTGLFASRRFHILFSTTRNCSEEVLQNYCAEIPIILVCPQAQETYTFKGQGKQGPACKLDHHFKILLAWMTWRCTFVCFAVQFCITNLWAWRTITNTALVQNLEPWEVQVLLFSCMCASYNSSIVCTVCHIWIL